MISRWLPIWHVASVLFAISARRRPGQPDPWDGVTRSRHGGRGGDDVSTLRCALTRVRSGQPTLAELGQRRLRDPAVVLVATIRVDGSPRLSPVEPLFWNGEPWLSMG